MGKKIKIAIAIIFILIISIVGVLIINPTENNELRAIKSEKELSRIYKGNDLSSKEIFANIITMPFSLLTNGYYSRGNIYTDTLKGNVNETLGSTAPESTALDSVSSVEESSATNLSKDYSTTNIQVENVDEADITKTDGDYIYSISDNNVIITNAKDPKEIKIETKIDLGDNIPEDLILYKNQLVVICARSQNRTTYSYYRNNNTVVNIYDITTKENPILLKEYELHEPYYTSRCINNNLYVIASGNLRKEDKNTDKIDRKYTEDSVEKEIEVKNIKKLKDVETTKQTLISMVDLENTSKKVNINSYLIDISNAYVSENNIYLLNQKYDYNTDSLEIKKMFGLKGVIGLFEDYDKYDYSSTYKTEIYKFDISKNGTVNYKTKNKIEGKTINQYSLDEKNGHLRVALYDNEGARIAIFNEDLKQIGITDYVAKGERMYSSRFIEDKAYLVTYKTIDPLFVIDLSNETKPEILGKLKIPGYSTYLHPYDENHLIGIGMETEEFVNRDSNGKVISNTARITGMKMALFDVTDVNNPVQISQTIIGDRRTTSAILTNPKALLFSKEKNLIAIPVNNYSEDFEISSSADTYSSLISSYTNYDKKYIAEGYFVYNINLEDGFKLKGIVTHDVSNKNKRKTTYGYYYNSSKLLRGLYINNNLYTVSEAAVKVNNLDTLELINELKIGE